MRNGITPLLPLTLPGPRPLIYALTLFPQAGDACATWLAAGLLDAQLQLARQSARQRTGFLDHPNGVASGLNPWASP